ncbi:hypothetical protein C8250_029000 [Streptomyces sp. So13.3]|uniref:hypothetical protein n=1 Tax=Streptomyces sp. So13.3 TaxID=2136173 RepID=UPI0011064EC6|nr:hypothetical protein [Streptomyces sp. So13.3]QNA75391.1 hypothetical protein C8250_029000 [Streptomyces sp. So13.3]
MSPEEAQRQLESILADAEPGEEATVQSAGQIENPHGDDNHTDAWAGIKEADGSVTIEKLHT